jgi:hypothetical protein
MIVSAISIGLETGIEWDPPSSSMTFALILSAVARWYSGLIALSWLGMTHQVGTFVAEH